MRLLIIIIIIIIIRVTVNPVGYNRDLYIKGKIMSLLNTICTDILT